MIYQYTSINEVVGRIIRNTRLQDTSLIPDIQEWIGEAMDLMHAKNQYGPAWEDVEIKFHKSRMPCGLIMIEAVEWCGTRLPYGNSVKNATTGQRPTRQMNDFPTMTSVVKKIETPNNSFIYTTDLEAVALLPVSTDQYYQTELGYIITSFETGVVRIHFQKVPVDNQGFPLIPDNGNFKEAIYWYVRSKMIESGFRDGVFKWDHCQAMFEIHAGRATAEIDFPSPDQMETRVKSLRNLVWPQNYFDEFFRVTDHEQFKERLI